MYVVLVTYNQGTVGIVHDDSGREPFFTYSLKEAKQQKKFCEDTFGNWPAKPTYKIYGLMEVE